MVVTPRNFVLNFRKLQPLRKHYAIIGMATVADDYPLYFEATNEKGLSMAGLNFPKNAHYYQLDDTKDNVTPFEFIPWVLGQCADLTQVRALLQRINLTKIPFSQDLPLSPLHWIIADSNGAITVETLLDGMKVYENPVGVLTNNPPFDIQLFYLNNYINLSAKEPVDRFASGLTLDRYSRGMGGLGLPGDLSSASRFVRATFTKLNSVSGTGEAESISQFFHILGAVTQQRGCAILGEEKYEITRYTSCCNTDRGIYYFTTYENSRICGVNMHDCDLSTDFLYEFMLPIEQDVCMINMLRRK